MYYFSVWQHIVCVGVTPKRIPKKYLCDFCQPRELDRYRAHSLQKMIRDDLNMLTSSDSSPTRSGDKDRGKIITFNFFVCDVKLYVILI